MSSPEVFLANEQEKVSIDEEFWAALARSVLAAEGVNGAAELSVLFVEPASIASLNQRFMGKTGPTDVLSFPIEEQEEMSGRDPDGGGRGPIGWGPRPSNVPFLLGDVVICPEVAVEAAAEHIGDRDHDGSFEDEIALLLIHGILHLRGMDHEEDDEAEVMEAREDELLRKLYRPLKGTLRR